MFTYGWRLACWLAGHLGRRRLYPLYSTTGQCSAVTAWLGGGPHTYRYKAWRLPFFANLDMPVRIIVQ